MWSLGARFASVKDNDVAKFALERTPARELHRHAVVSAEVEQFESRNWRCGDIGFDNEKPGAGDRIVQFVEKTAIPTALFSMLQVLPDTALWHRLKKEGRLGDETGNINQTTLMNFVPTRPLEDIAREYMHAFSELYEPHKFLDRVYRHHLIMGSPKFKAPSKIPSWVDVRALLTVCWQQGFVRSTRFQFWRNLWNIFKHNPKVWDRYLTVCAHNEHFSEYRQIVCDEIEAQLTEYLATKAETQKTAQTAVPKVNAIAG